MATPSVAMGALALGALAVGALAIGALAIGRLRILRADADRLHLGTVEIDDLTVKRLRVIETAGEEDGSGRPERACFSDRKLGKERAPLFLQCSPRPAQSLHEHRIGDLRVS